MRDRTKELGNPADGSDEDGEGTALMMKPGTVTSMKEDRENEAFFRKVYEIREGLETLKKKVFELENKQKTVLGVALPEESMKKELQTIRDEIKVLANQIQKKLKSIEPKKTDEDGKYVPINLRMQRTQHAVLSRDFLESMSYCNTIQAHYRDRNVERIQRQLKISEYPLLALHAVLSRDFLESMSYCNTIQAHYRDRNVERIQRQLKITGNNVTDEQLESMLESGQTDVFTQNILTDAQATRQALNEIESRHDEILKLEKSIRDLHDMFQYLAMEVEAQGEMVNRIENNIINSTNYVEKAVEDTQAAVVSQNRARKKKICIAVCIAILVLIIVISLGVTFS